MGFAATKFPRSVGSCHFSFILSLMERLTVGFRLTALYLASLYKQINNHICAFIVNNKARFCAILSGATREESEAQIYEVSIQMKRTSSAPTPGSISANPAPPPGLSRCQSFEGGTSAMVSWDFGSESCNMRMALSPRRKMSRIFSHCCTISAGAHPQKQFQRTERRAVVFKMIEEAQEFRTQVGEILCWIANPGRKPEYDRRAVNIISEHSHGVKLQLVVGRVVGRSFGTENISLTQSADLFATLYSR